MSSGKKLKMDSRNCICSDSQCSNVNSARRTNCNSCGKEKTAIPKQKHKKLVRHMGKTAAGKSKGLFCALDWRCGRCDNVNWARRQKCNKCNAPKFGETEERTELGDDHNESENEEYIEIVESDEEYNESLIEDRCTKKILENELESSDSLKKSGSPSHLHQDD